MIINAELCIIPTLGRAVPVKDTEQVRCVAEWSDEKCRNAVLLGMYFLANY